MDDDVDGDNGVIDKEVLRDSSDTALEDSAYPKSHDLTRLLDCRVEAN